MNNRFGTSSGMVIQTVEESGKTLYLAIDTKGLYFTTQNRIDTGLADTNRYAVSRENVASRLEALGLAPETLLAENGHRIQIANAAAKKVNPLKASKRSMR